MSLLLLSSKPVLYPFEVYFKLMRKIASFHHENIINYLKDNLTQLNHSHNRQMHRTAQGKYERK